MEKTKLTTDSFKDGEVKTDDINNANVTTEKFASNSVTAGKINNGVVSSDDLASTLDLSNKTITLAESSFNPVNYNVALLGFKMAVNENLTVFNLVDGVVDEFHDESGTDEGEGSNDTYCASSDFYNNSVNISAGFSTTARTESDTSTAGTNPAFKTGTYGSFTVPSGVTSVNIQAWGAGGGQGNDPQACKNNGGGGGGYTEGTLAVTASQVMRIVVGEGGQIATSQPTPSTGKGLGGAGGFPGSATSSDSGSYGGGMSGVFTCAVASSPIVLTGYSAPAALLISGGGGGGGRNSTPTTVTNSGGAGGGLIGDAGGTTTEQTNRFATAGGGGDQEQGGQGGASEPGSNNGSDGVLFGGGNPASDADTGTGGGGYYGGGGASGAGGFPYCNNQDLRSGGGGSSYFGHPQITSGSTEEGSANSGGGTTQPGYVSSTNEGTTYPGSSGVGEDGYVLISASSATATTIVSNAFTASSAPSTSRIVVFQENIDSITLNTDLVASVSRNGGSNFSTVTLVDEGYVTGASGQRILAGLVDISGQPSGTSMRWKLALDNNQSKIHGVALSWG